MKFFVASTGDGAGIANILQQDGSQVTLFTKGNRLQLDGIVPKVMSVKAGMAGDPDVVVFDGNGFGAEADYLRTQQKKVFGSSRWQDKIETDWKFAKKAMASFGIRTPAMFAFDNIVDAMKFTSSHPNRLEYVNGQKAYSGASQDATLEYLAWIRKKNPGPCLMREVIKGPRISTEVWFAEGEPVPYPIGSIHSEGSTVSWWYPTREPKIVQQSIKKIYAFTRQVKYTGPLAINGVVRNGRFYGLDFGPNRRFQTLCSINQVSGRLGNLIERAANGAVSGVNRKEGYGLSVTVCAEEEGPDGCPVSGFSKAEWAEGSVVPIYLQATKTGFAVSGDEDEVLEICSSGSSVWEAETKAAEIYKRLNLPGKYASIGLSSKDCDRRLGELYHMGYEVPPLFEPMKREKTEQVMAVPVMAQPVKEEVKNEQKDDRAEIAKSIGCKPGAIAAPLHRFPRAGSSGGLGE